MLQKIFISFAVIALLAACTAPAQLKELVYGHVGTRVEIVV